MPCSFSQSSKEEPKCGLVVIARSPFAVCGPVPNQAAGSFGSVSQNHAATPCGRAVAGKVAPHLPQSAAKGPAERHAYRPSELHGADVMPEGAAVLQGQAVK